MQNNQGLDRQPTMTLSVALPYDIWRRLEAIKREEGITKAHMITKGLRLWFEQYELGKAS